MTTKTMKQFESLTSEMLASVGGGENWVQVGPSRECIDGKIFGTCRTRWDWIMNHAFGYCIVSGIAAYAPVPHCGRP